MMAVLALWLLGAAALFAIMWLPPARFCAIIARVPAPVFMMAMPFRQMWMVARGGRLQSGSPAPDFELRRQDKSGTVRLSSHAGSRPVVLIFGSYT